MARVCVCELVRPLEGGEQVVWPDGGGWGLRRRRSAAVPLWAVRQTTDETLWSTVARDSDASRGSVCARGARGRRTIDVV